MRIVSIKNNDWDYEYDQYEEVYRNSLMMVEIIEENRRLKMENERLQQELEQYRYNLNKQYRDVNNQVASILTTLVNQGK